VAQVMRTRSLELAGLGKALVRELADRLEQAVARPPASALADRHDRPIDQTREHVERQAGNDGERSTCLEPAHKHGERPERSLLIAVEQRVAPLDRGADGAVALGKRPPGAAERVEPCVERSEDLCRRHHAHPRCGQLNRQREMIEASAQHRDRHLGLPAGKEIGSALTRSLDEQSLSVVSLERIQPPHGLAAHTKEFTTRRENVNAGTGAEEAGRQFSARIDDVLAVVQHEQDIAIGQVPAQRVRRRRAAATTDRQRSRYLGGGIRIRRSGQIDEPHTIGAATDLPARELNPEPGFARTAGTGNRHQAATPQCLADRIELARPPDQRRERDWQVVRLSHAAMITHRRAQSPIRVCADERTAGVPYSAPMSKLDDILGTFVPAQLRAQEAIYNGDVGATPRALVPRGPSHAVRRGTVQQRAEPDQPDVRLGRIALL
jgi:hypothetical protein